MKRRRRKMKKSQSQRVIHVAAPTSFRAWPLKQCFLQLLTGQIWITGLGPLWPLWATLAVDSNPCWSPFPPGKAEVLDTRLQPHRAAGTWPGSQHTLNAAFGNLQCNRHFLPAWLFLPACITQHGGSLNLVDRWAPPEFLIPWPAVGSELGMHPAIPL